MSPGYVLYRYTYIIIILLPVTNRFVTEALQSEFLWLHKKHNNQPLFHIYSNPFLKYTVVGTALPGLFNGDETHLNWDKDRFWRGHNLNLH